MSMREANAIDRSRWFTREPGQTSVREANAIGRSRWFTPEPGQTSAPDGDARSTGRHTSGSHRARRWLKESLAGAVEGSSLGRWYRALRMRTTGAQIHVLGYHRIVDAIDWEAPVNPSLCMTTEAFRRQMEQLREQLEVLPMATAMQAIAGNLALERDAATVTFDDGYRDVLLRAHPILAELGIPATVFVPTGFARQRYLPHDRLYAALFGLARRKLELSELELPRAIASQALLRRAAQQLGRGDTGTAVDQLIHSLPTATLKELIAVLEVRVGPPALDEGAQVLSPAEVRALAQAGWEIGGHTIGHVVLTHEPPDEVRRQIVGCKAALERWSGHPCRYFAYCNGLYDATLVAELARAGYEGAVTTYDRPNQVGATDPFRLGRKVLWEDHVRGVDGHFSRWLSTAHLHDLFGVLRLTRPIDGDQDRVSLVHTHNNIMQTHNNVVQAHHAAAALVPEVELE
jgi:peptidoglycan/xylan/chitin deacetylase (PgdA/CDA1 family)